MSSPLWPHASQVQSAWDIASCALKTEDLPYVAAMHAALLPILHSFLKQNKCGNWVKPTVSCESNCKYNPIYPVGRLQWIWRGQGGWFWSYSRLTALWWINGLISPNSMCSPLNYKSMHFLLIIMSIHSLFCLHDLCHITKLFRKSS